MSNQRFHSFVIFGAVRTGSNYLERSLEKHPQISTYGELFNPDFFGHRDQETAFGFDLADREKNPLQILAAMRRETKGLPGFRLFERHDPRVKSAVLGDAKAAKIILHRPLMDSYLSLMIARKTDQWILGDARSRKSAKITFDGPDFERYRTAQAAYYNDLEQALQESGQTAFHIRFDQLGDADILNGLVRFLGVDGDLEGPDTSLKPQNPGPRASKVTNPEALLVYSASESEERTPRTPQLRRMITSDTFPLLFAPIAGCDPVPIARWMISKEERHSQATLKDWQDNNPGFTSFSVITDPMARAYEVFARRIIEDSEDSYPKIRRRLVKFHDLELPKGDDPKLWQASFLAFLGFLERNLAGQTGIRIDDDWALQSDLLAAINAQQPVMRLIKSQDLLRDLPELCPKNPQKFVPQKANTPPLKAIATPQIERLARKIYRLDYRKFGF